MFPNVIHNSSVSALCQASPSHAEDINLHQSPQQVCGRGFLFRSCEECVIALLRASVVNVPLNY